MQGLTLYLSTYLFVFINYGLIQFIKPIFPIDFIVLKKSTLELGKPQKKSSTTSGRATNRGGGL